MEIRICQDPERLGRTAAAHAARVLRRAIEDRGEARVALSTGASQFELFKALIREDVDWPKVEMFHLDEYAGLPETHPASFRKYLKERFLAHVNMGKCYFVEDDPACIPELTWQLRRAPVDLGLIGIGQNAHIAFNDPPADFDTREAYIPVSLDEDCKAQQVSEGWFAAAADVPKTAITMTVHQILQCACIISCVPGEVKAGAVRRALLEEKSPWVPATVLREHPDFTLYLEPASAGQVLSPEVRWP